MNNPCKLLMKLYICAKLLDTELSISISKTQQDFSIFILNLLSKMIGTILDDLRVPASSKTMLLLPVT